MPEQGETITAKTKLIQYSIRKVMNSSTSQHLIIITHHFAHPNQPLGLSVFVS